MIFGWLVRRTPRSQRRRADLARFSWETGILRPSWDSWCVIGEELTASGSMTTEIVTWAGSARRNRRLLGSTVRTAKAGKYEVPRAGCRSYSSERLAR
jgi:hypothetical protein